MSKREPIDADLRKRLLAIPVPTLSATLFAKGFENAFIAGLSPLDPDSAAFVGTAYTMRALPTRGDLLAAVNAGDAPNLHRQAMSELKAGEVIVTDCGGLRGVSFFGELITTYLERKGVAAIVTDAGIADVADVAAVGMPVFSQGSAPVPGPAQALVGDLNRPVNCMGVTVLPGDLLVGDANGIVVIPAAIAETIAAAAEEKEALERYLLGKLRAGAELDGTYPPDTKTLDEYNRERGQ